MRKKLLPWAHGDHGGHGSGPNDHGSVKARRGHSSVTARSQLNHGIFSMITAQSWLGHSSVTAGCDHFGHRELTVSSHGGQFLYARLKNGRIMPWQCPSVRLSVRPSVRVFRTFLPHALRYQFETWYIHSVGDTTCRVWVASQLGHFDLVYSPK